MKHWMNKIKIEILERRNPTRTSFKPFFISNIYLFVYFPTFHLSLQHNLHTRVSQWKVKYLWSRIAEENLETRIGCESKCFNPMRKYKFYAYFMSYCEFYNEVFTRIRFTRVCDFTFVTLCIFFHFHFAYLWVVNSWSWWKSRKSFEGDRKKNIYSTMFNLSCWQ